MQRTHAAMPRTLMKFSRIPPLRRITAACLLLAVCGLAQAQQDTADRLWQGAEQQSQQIQQQAEPAPLEEAQPATPEADAVAALAKLPPMLRLQQLLLATLNAVNRRDWAGAEHWLQAYAEVPEHDPVLFDFVAASRASAEGRHAEAIAGYRKVLAANPKFTRGSLDLARTLYADNRLGDAEAVFRDLREQPLPPQVIRHIDDYLAALKRRQQMRFSLSVSGVREDNVNRASTVVDRCALVFFGNCLANRPGKEITATGTYVEGTLNKLWSLAGNHGVMLRSIGYGNLYASRHEYDNLVSTTYLGYQYASARNQLQVLPLLEYDREGGRKAYQAAGLRTSFTRQLGARAQVEASHEYKHRDFSRALEYLEGDFRGLSLFGNYALRRNTVVYGGLMWRRSDAQRPVFAYREEALRLGLYQSFADKVTTNVSYGYRRKLVAAEHPLFGERQRDREHSLYLNVSLPAYAWRGVTPTMSYEYRDNTSNIAHAYSFEKSRLSVGFNWVF